MEEPERVRGTELRGGGVGMEEPERVRGTEFQGGGGRWSGRTREPARKLCSSRKRDNREGQGGHACSRGAEETRLMKGYMKEKCFKTY